LNFTVEVLKGQKLDMPRIETPSHWITMGFDKDLNLAWDGAKAQTIKLLGEQRKLSAAQAADTIQKVSDCRVSQVVNVKKGIHCLNPKNVKATDIAERPTTETKDYFVTVGRDADANKAMDIASMGMIKLLQEKKNLSRLDAYGLASVALDCRIGEMSANAKSIHCVLPKNLWVSAK
jgi:acetamidase/formamidase